MFGVNYDPTEINELGHLLSKIPINPRFAKMLIVGSKHNILKYCIMMVSCMNVSEIFIQ
jgi:ATP-dependent RNA helicase DHX37/DHR1